KMIDEQQEENLFLDFKLKTDATSSNLSKDDKKNYAKALSGFSNTSGGIIIWGVDCRKNEEGVDGASGWYLLYSQNIFSEFK
ncbi:ATP-binding protein, partial [Leptospira santarosai]|nr:ATP-binding protein [Leptospira santarosai]